MLNFKNKTEINKDLGFYTFDNVLDDKFFESVSNQFSNNKDKYGSKGWNGKRVSLQLGTKDFENYTNKNKKIKELSDYLISEKCFNELNQLFNKKKVQLEVKDKYIDNISFTNKFTEFTITSNILKKIIIKFIYWPLIRKLNIRYLYRKVFNFFQNPTAYPLLSINLSMGSYLEPVHLDSRHKLIVGLLYFDNIEKGGEISVFKKKEKDNIKNYIKYPKENDLKVLTKIKSKSNRLVIFLNSNNAYHGTNDFKGIRRFIYFSYAIKNEESCFKTNYSVTKGDASNSEL